MTTSAAASQRATHELLGTSRALMERHFEWRSLSKMRPAPAQQALWAAHAKTQTTIQTAPTHGGVPVDESLARQRVPERSRWFLSRNLALSSQGIAVAMIRNLVHGGRSWNALQGLSDENARCLTLFYNSTLGAIVWRAYGQKGQRGPRAAMQVGAILGLPCPDFNGDTPDAQRARNIAAEHFDRLSRLPLEPFAYCFRDTNRHAIDSVVAEMLGLDPRDDATQKMLAHYRMLFASEPNVNGRQKRIVQAIADYQASSSA